MSNLTNKNDIYLYEKPISKNAGYKMWMAFPGVASFALSSLGYLRKLTLKCSVPIQKQQNL